MKCSSYEQFAIVAADSASLFTEELNAEIYRLKDNNPVVRFSESIPFYAQIKYTVTETTPETVSEEYELQGVRFTCAQCPYFVPGLKADGTEDKRCKYGYCTNVEPRTAPTKTFKDMAACEGLYELINGGEVKLCFTE